MLIILYRVQLRELENLAYVGAFLTMLIGHATVGLTGSGLTVVYSLGSTLNPLLVGLFAGPDAALGLHASVPKNASRVFAGEFTQLCGLVEFLHMSCKSCAPKKSYLTLTPILCYNLNTCALRAGIFWKGDAPDGICE